MVDVAMLDGAVSWNVYHQLLSMLGGGSPPVRGMEQLTGGYACYNVYETRDGRWLTIGAYEPHFWATLCRAVGREDLIPHQWAEGEQRATILAMLPRHLPHRAARRVGAAPRGSRHLLRPGRHARRGRRRPPGRPP